MRTRNKSLARLINHRTRINLSARVIKYAGPQKLYPNKEGLDPL